MALRQVETSAYPSTSKPGYARVAGDANKADLMTRLIHGMTGHLRLRMPSWAMSMTILTYGFIVTGNPAVLNHTPETAARYAYMLRAASLFSFLHINPALLCGYFCLTVGALRMFSLVINGTFVNFPWSLQIRALGSFLSCFIWFQILLGVFFNAQDWALAVPVYCVFLWLDTFNLYLATLEINREGI